MLSLQAFRRLAARQLRRVPAEFLAELHAGVVVLAEAKQQDRDLPGVYVLGEYVEDPYGLGRSIVLYYGSFRALFGDSPRRVWEAELWETLLHEVRHHLESLAGVSDLEEEDLYQLRAFRAWQRQGQDPAGPHRPPRRR